MPKSRPPYPAEYRRRIIELARAGRSMNELAREFRALANAIRYGLKRVIVKCCGLGGHDQAATLD